LNTKNTGLFKIFNSEIPDISSNWAWLERLFLVGFILVFTLAFVRTYPTIFLGFGLGDEYAWRLIFSFFEDLKKQSPVLFYSSLIMLTANVLFRFQLFIRGQFSYRSNHPKLPIKTVVLYMVANALNIVFVAISVLILAMVSVSLGYDFNTGLNAVENLMHIANNYAAFVPTIIELPLLMAFILTYVIQGFFHYWIHRLCHLNRFLWLVLHRFHHMPTVLTPSTTNVVITSVPFFLGIVFVKTFIFSLIAKLFCPQDLMMEMFFFHLIITFADPYGHQSALFKEGIQSRWISTLCFFSGNGVYHYLHHSRDTEIVTSNTTNQVNIGGGIAYIWDHIFGTFKPLPSASSPTPQVGLWGDPALHHNPIRLLLSGLIQIAYEVYANKGLTTKLRCVFSSVHYNPPVSRHFHISDTVKKP
jgi:sterol desaturase/sphingolipid hydroxylase (fatty acid hydroxylase superfamily)